MKVFLTITELVSGAMAVKLSMTSCLQGEGWSSSSSSLVAPSLAHDSANVLATSLSARCSTAPRGDAPGETSSQAGTSASKRNMAGNLRHLLLPAGLVGLTPGGLTCNSGHVLRQTTSACIRGCLTTGRIGTGIAGGVLSLASKQPGRQGKRGTTAREGGQKSTGSTRRTVTCPFP